MVIPMTSAESPIPESHFVNEMVSPMTSETPEGGVGKSVIGAFARVKPKGQFPNTAAERAYLMAEGGPGITEPLSGYHNVDGSPIIVQPMVPGETLVHIKVSSTPVQRP